MSKTKRVAHAPEEPLPELDEFLALFRFKFRRRESREATERYLAGLLTEHPNKNCDASWPIPGIQPNEPSSQTLHGLIVGHPGIQDDLLASRRTCVQLAQRIHAASPGVHLKCLGFGCWRWAAG